MTGPGEGKLKIKATVFLNSEKIDAVVYIHLKGKSLARVTHLDIESTALNILPPKGGGFFDIYGVKNGLEVVLPNRRILVDAPLLKKVLPNGRKTRTWVGGKYGGIYVGFRKTEITKLEEIAQTIA